MGRYVWEDTTYLIAPKNCNNVEYKFLLKLWQVTPDALTRLFENSEEPQEYATSLQYTREWSELDQSDKDIIWRLEYKSGTSNSACYNQHSMEIPADNTHEMVFNNKPRTAQRQQFIKVMKRCEDPPAMTACFSLDYLKSRLSFLLERKCSSHLLEP